MSEKAKTRQQIADELGVSKTTLWRLLKRMEIELPNGLVYPKKQQEIYEKIVGHQEQEEKETN
ncbi:MAG TPA: helix-turn-helix domain-containing protein [Saprospiraceae bacterium]|nr:helix-turn-helix domain-containing protein [Saprospiraceae bacterium]HMQ85299.1 helix-turn-helix domain-containing protein [Saprospiraceae bacterium]